MTDEIEVEIYNEDESALRPGTLLCGGKYRIVHFLSKGGFGKTYEAEHILLHKRVAIKEFFPRDMCNRDKVTSHVTVGTESKRKLVEKLHKKFVQEAQAVAQFKHPGIVQVSDVFEENETAYYVMEYIEGGSLKDKVESVGRLSEADAVRYIRQVCDALAYVHSQNCLHLDLKPANIMVNEEDKPVLIDFGTSRQYDEVAGESTGTLPTFTKGYAPPEQTAQVIRTFYPATDIYALGMTLYKLLTGVTPKTADERISGDELDPLPSSVSTGTRAAVEAAVRLNKKSRPQSVAEFLALLDGGKQKQSPKPKPKPVKPEDTEDTEVKSTKPPKSPEPPKPPTPPDPHPHRSTLLAILVGALVAVVAAVCVYVATHQSGPGTPDTVVDVTPDTTEVLPSEEVSSVIETAIANRIEEKEEPEAVQTGSIDVSCGPKGSTIKIDGESVGTTPKTITDLSVGKHTVEVSESGYESRSWTVDVKANGMVTLSEDLSAKQSQPVGRVVSGTVLDSNKEPLVGALIAIKGSDSGTLTDFDGNFNLRVPDDNAILIISYVDFKTLEVSSTSDLSAIVLSPLSSAKSGTINGHEWVNLGLSVKWATCNVGASKPSDYGNYYAWGETSTKSTYTEENSKTYYNSSYNYDIGGNSSLDAVRANWGGSWRLPTKSEMQELVDKCTWTWTTQGGHNGYRVTGPNGSSIFLPAAGHRGKSLNTVSSGGKYWTSTPYEGNSGNAYYLLIDVSGTYVGWVGGSRNYGRTVRPVAE